MPLSLLGRQTKNYRPQWVSTTSAEWLYGFIASYRPRSIGVSACAMAVASAIKIRLEKRVPKSLTSKVA